MLQINSLTITHKKDLRTIVQDLDLVLNRGDKVEVVVKALDWERDRISPVRRVNGVLVPNDAGGEAPGGSGDGAS